VSETTQTDPNVCYRHPNRQSWVLCQRCGRTICPACQTPAAVGVHCPECVAEARAATPRAVRRASGRSSGFVRWLRSAFAPGSSMPVVTWTIAAIAIVVFLLSLGFPQISNALAYIPLLTVVEPWRMLTVVFVHASFLHIIFNLWALLVTGPAVEAMLGRIRFLALFLLSTLGGSVLVLLLAPTTSVVGMSGAIFGLFGATFILLRGLGANPTMLLIVIAVNLVFSFLPGSNVAWQAHVGGLVVGALIGWLLVSTRRRNQRGLQIGLLIGAFAALVGLTVLGVVLHGDLFDLVHAMLQQQGVAPNASPQIDQQLWRTTPV